MELLVIVLVLVLVLEVKGWLAPREDLTYRSYWSHKSYPVAAPNHWLTHPRAPICPYTVPIRNDRGQRMVRFSSDRPQASPRS